jgi:integrase/recombinase XerD
MSSMQLATLRERLGEVSLGTVINRFLDYLGVEAGLSENTLLGYGRDLLAFSQFCRLHYIQTMDQLTPKVIYDYQRSLSANGRAEATINRALVAIKMLLRFGAMVGRINDDFTSMVEGPKLWQKLPVVANKHKVMDLLNAPTESDPYYLRDKALLELLYATGCRASEAAGIGTKDLNLKIGYIRCFGKGNKERVIPLGRTAIGAIEVYLEHLRPKLVKPFSGDVLFLSRTGRGMDRIDVWRIVKKYARRAGMPGNLTVHTLRHCFATHLLSGGADLRSVQEMLGHTDIATTQIYTHVDQDRLRSIHKQFHPRG